MVIKARIFFIAGITTKETLYREVSLLGYILLNLIILIPIF
jgi:hypothetical protein